MSLVISADSHIIEALDLWTKVLAAKYGERLPQLVSECNGEPGTYFFTGLEYVNLGAVEPRDTKDSTAATSGMSDALVDKVNRSNTDPAIRLELMQLDGIAAEVINPTIALLTMRAPDPRMVFDCCRLYNDWIADYCSADPKRLLGSALIPTDEVERAIGELRRIAKKGLCNAIVYTDVKPNMKPYRDRHYDRFWAAAVDLDIPIQLHVIPGQTRDPYTLQTPAERELIPKQYLAIMSEPSPILANEFVFGGIFDRHPKLQVILGEREISWFPYFLFRLRQLEGGLGESLRMWKIKKPVDEYMRTQVWHGFTDDQFFDLAYKVVGSDRIMWGSDFPHPRNTFPNSRKIIDRVLKNVPPKVKADVAGRNAARLFKIDPPKSKTEAAVPVKLRARPTRTKKATRR
ncbi:MAG: amidohydrolase [Alphaproteobacteria bacterium]|nr:amidohydrolase [Alphaproteobacteria bacterium]